VRLVRQAQQARREFRALQVPLAQPEQWGRPVPLVRRVRLDQPAQLQQWRARQARQVRLGLRVFRVFKGIRVLRELRARRVPLLRLPVRGRRVADQARADPTTPVTLFSTR